MKATHSLFINKHSPDSKGLCSITVRITYNRKKRYYPTDIKLSVDVYQKVMGERPRKELKEISMELKAFEQRALDILKQIPNFSWEKFDALYYTDRSKSEHIETGYSRYIAKLQKEDCWGTASSYQCSINSLNKFKSNLKYEDVTPSFLREYEKKMLSEGKSKSTIGIYLRPLRAIFNLSINDGLISRDMMPFGSRKKNLYEIPTSKNIKKAISIDKIEKIFKYEPANQREAEYRDYWIFLYLCNGMNVKDMCLLKYKNIKGDTIEYIRAKTVNTKREESPIVIAVLPEVQSIIDKWGNKNISPDKYIFSHLIEGMTLKKQRAVIQQVTKQINKYIARVAAALGIENKIRTYTARHTFGSILKKNGNNVAFIKDAYGHGTIQTTERYLASLEVEDVLKAATALTKFN
jgi:integrase/recombinase XerD